MIKVIKSKDLHQYLYNQHVWYFLIPEGEFSSEIAFQHKCSTFYSNLNHFKEKLEKRWTPHPIKWWEWAFPRNKKLLESNKIKIFIPCKDRYDTRKFVRFSLNNGEFYANQDVTALVKDPHVKESEQYITAYLNSDIIFKWLINKGLVRGGVIEFSEKPLTEIPFRMINWNDPNEVNIHDNITKVVEHLIQDKNDPEKAKITLNNHIMELIDIRD